MNRTTFIVLILLLLVMLSACQSGGTNEQQMTANNPPADSNINNTTRSALLTDTPTPTVRISPPQIFVISDADVERAFAEGERLYQDIRRSGGRPPTFGVEKKVDFRLPERAELSLSITFKKPRDEAKERGYLFAQRGGASERAEILTRTRQLIAQRAKQIVFHVQVTKWRNPAFGDENTPLVQFTVNDSANNPIRPTGNPQLDFCVGRDIISCVAGTAVVFPLYRNEQPLLTNAMESVALAISVDETGDEITFPLR